LGRCIVNPEPSRAVAIITQPYDKFQCHRPRLNTLTFNHSTPLTLPTTLPGPNTDDTIHFTPLISPTATPSLNINDTVFASRHHARSSPTATMGRAEAGSTKWVANQMRSKGLQRLRWWCEVCPDEARKPVEHLLTDARHRHVKNSVATPTASSATSNPNRMSGKWLS
jgi:hypothetical protein